VKRELEVAAFLVGAAIAGYGVWWVVNHASIPEGK